MKNDEVCKMNCTKKDVCNKRFSGNLQKLDEDVVYIQAGCGKVFRVSKEEAKRIL